MSMNNNYEQLRTLHDDKHMNYYDRLRLKAQKERTIINSAPTIKKMEERGCIFHEPPPKTAKPINFHSIALNHSVVPRNNF